MGVRSAHGGRRLRQCGCGGVGAPGGRWAARTRRRPGSGTRLVRIFGCLGASGTDGPLRSGIGCSTPMRGPSPRCAHFDPQAISSAEGWPRRGIPDALRPGWKPYLHCLQGEGECGCVSWGASPRRWVRRPGSVGTGGVGRPGGVNVAPESVSSELGGSGLLNGRWHGAGPRAPGRSAARIGAHGNASAEKRRERCPLPGSMERASSRK
jgi:hypothetical protein